MPQFVCGVACVFTWWYLSNRECRESGRSRERGEEGVREQESTRVWEEEEEEAEEEELWLGSQRKSSGLESSREEPHTRSSLRSTAPQRSTRRGRGREPLVAAWKRSMPRAHSEKEVMPSEVI